ncbi:ferrochelatase [Magnetovirga frankeli]|uniref:ferrochelatase n=1 Tax=Magnetovirga frankeli TaxID=947516 RepID=UPI001292E2D6|nr:ferrochelatase [gamma proteobacterium SS-5]
MAQAQNKTGILLTNLGTPDAPEAPALKRYLKEFLSDRRVVELHPLAWQPILRGIILNVRPKKSAAAYRQVWSEEGSPLLAIALRQTAALCQFLHQQGLGEVPVELAMRYGNPSMESVLDRLMAQGLERIILLPLYPQYSASTSASTFDQLARVLMARRNIPAIDFIRSYPDEPAYIQALANSVREYQQEHGEPDRLLISFHGIPRDYADKGDPYPQDCATTARLLAEELGLRDEQWLQSFQSRFGLQEWLKPYTDETLKKWGKEGLDHVQVICPGFSADCLETLEEIDEENREYFLHAGGKRFGYIPALNDRADHIAALGGILLRHLGVV